MFLNIDFNVSVRLQQFECIFYIDDDNQNFAIFLKKSKNLFGLKVFVITQYIEYRVVEKMVSTPSK